MKEKIGAFVEEIISGQPDIFLVEVILKGNPGNQKLLILIDGDEGINIDTCAEISRSLGARLEEEDLIDGKYTLEVSSPGLDMPIILLRQYVKNIGRNVNIELLEGDKIQGKLKSASKETIEIELPGNESRNIDMKDINRTFVEVSFR